MNINKIQIVNVPYIILVLLLLFACNASKRMNKQADKAISNPYVFGKVGTAWIMKYGCLADTLRDTVIFGNPNVVYIDTTIHDTIPQVVPCKTFHYVTRRGVIVNVDSTGHLTVIDNRRDSVKYITQTRYVTVTDRKTENLLRAALDSTGSENKELKATIAQQKERLKNAHLWQWVIGMAGAAGIGFLVWSKFK